jgi:exosortase
VSRSEWLAVALTLLVLVVFYGVFKHFGPMKGEPAAVTWTNAWNKESDFEHGWIFPPLVIGLIFWRRNEIMASRTQGESLGLALALAGALLYVVSYRTIQWRVAIVGLPFLLTGSAWYFWGRKTALLLAFPFFLTWLAIPVGFLQQATGGLQLIASKLAYLGSSAFGVQTSLMGNKITMADGSGYDVDEGCSGVRSLWALLLISAAWTYVARMAVWKKGLLFVSSFPIAILGNSLRLISIFVMAEYGNATFAKNTWHDWSPLVLFYPFSLFLLLAVHSILEGGLPWKKSRLKIVRSVVVTQTSGKRPDPATP